MRHRTLAAASVAALALGAAGATPARAQLVDVENAGSATAESIFAAGGFLPPMLDTRSFGPLGGVAVAEVDYRHFGRMRAVQTGYGLNAVYVDARVADIPRFDFSARTSYELSVRNAGSRPLDVDFTYHINGGSLQLYDPRALFDHAVATVGVSVFTISPGASGFLWAWTLSLRGDGSGGVTPSVDFLIDPYGFGVPALSPVSIANGVASVEIAPFTASIGLGPIGTGGTALVTYDMDARVSGLFFAHGGRAALGDPFDAEGDYGAGITLTPAVSTVPEPSAVSLVALGLAGMGVAASRRRRRQRDAVRPTAAA